MKEDIYYYKKFPKGSEFSVGHYFSIILIFVFLIVIYLAKYYPDTGSLLVTLIIFFYIFFGSRVRLMKSLLIRKIEESIKENAELSQKHKDVKKYLITNSGYNRLLDFKSEIRYLLIGVMLFAFLYGITITSDKLENVSRFYLSLVYLCIWITMFSFKRLENVFNYFQNIRGICNKIILSNSDEDLKPLQEHLAGQSNCFQKNKWRKVNKISILVSIPNIVISLLLIWFNPFYSLVVMMTGGVIFLGVNTIFLDKKVNRCLSVISDYDEFVKEKLRIIYNPKTSNEGFSDFADELNKDIKNIFR
jgi:hypothetical protein